MFAMTIMPPLEIKEYLTGFRYYDQCYLLVYPGYRLSKALRQVANRMWGQQAAAALMPVFREMSYSQREDVAGVGRIELGNNGFYDDLDGSVRALTQALIKGRLNVYTLSGYYFSRLCNYQDIFYKPAADGRFEKDDISQSTNKLWRALGGDSEAPSEVDVSLPPLSFPALQQLGSVNVALSEQAIHTNSEIVPQKLMPMQVNEKLAKELETLGCDTSLARTALERGLNRWHALSNEKAGRQLLHFFWLDTDPNAAQQLIVAEGLEAPTYAFKLPAEVFIALGAVGFKNRQGITDPRVRVGPFNISAILAMAELADRITHRASVAAMEAEALRDDVGPQSRSASIWADLPTNYYIQIRLSHEDGSPAEHQPWRIETPDGRTHTGATNLHGVGRVSGLEQQGMCQITFPNAWVAKAGASPGSAKPNAVFSEPVNGEYAFVLVQVHWVSAVLRDTEGNPLPNQPWWVKTADGTEHSGMTDAEGCLRLENVPAAANCDIRFPELSVLKNGTETPPASPQAKQHYEIQQGDTLLRIAKAHGFNSGDELYYHPANAAFRKLRPNPNIIYPGDKIAIPATLDHPFNGEMDKTHEFVKARDTELFEVEVFDNNQRALVGKRAVLTVGAKRVEKILTADGTIGLPLDEVGDATEAQLEIYLTDDSADPPERRAIAITRMDPVDTVSGIQARCNNLGYDSGVIDGVLGGKTQDAIRAFQAAQGLKVDGEPGPLTQNALETVYGC